MARLTKLRGGKGMRSVGRSHRLVRAGPLLCLLFLPQHPGSAQVDSLASGILGEVRPVQLWLPPEYGTGTDAYPVVVVLDGGALFRYTAALFDVVAPSYLPEAIVVGLPNTSRSRDLDPSDNTLGIRGRGVERFQDFLANELFPWLELRYRVQPYRLLLGHSLAGSFVLHTRFHRPELFQGYIASSPSLIPEVRYAAVAGALLDEPAASGLPPFLFVSMGEQEGEDFIGPIRSFAEEIPEWVPLEVRMYPGEGHVPLLGFHEGVRTAFSDWFPYEAFGASDWAGLKVHYEALSSRVGFTVLPPVGLSLAVARRLEAAGDGEGALLLLQELCAFYPHDPRVIAELEAWRLGSGP